MTRTHQSIENTIIDYEQQKETPRGTIKDLQTWVKTIENDGITDSGRETNLLSRAKSILNQYSDEQNSIHAHTAKGCKAISVAKFNDLSIDGSTDGKMPDDGLTGQLTGTCEKEGSSTYLDLKAYTDKAEGIRADQIEIGHVKYIDFEGKKYKITVGYGGQLKGTGNYGGEQIQNFIHDAIGSDPVHLDYKGSGITAGVQGHILVQYDINGNMALYSNSGAKLNFDGSGDAYIEMGGKTEVLGGLTLGLGYKGKYDAPGAGIPNDVTLDPFVHGPTASIGWEGKRNRVSLQTGPGGGEQGASWTGLVYTRSF